ncbi:MAG: hypothetical protein BWZ07_02888 [Alphaproteobacteria bacterium ADurb.BinA280]|nr:MAG: hypothetical protein BWZ07_02888 [Alphaproteobacteria bacterium ADurb.BinA280]
MLQLGTPCTDSPEWHQTQVLRLLTLDHQGEGHIAAMQPQGLARLRVPRLMTMRMDMFLRGGGSCQPFRFHPTGKTFDQTDIANAIAGTLSPVLGPAFVVAATLIHRHDTRR